MARHAALGLAAATQSWTIAEGTVTAASPGARQFELRPRSKPHAAATPTLRRNPLVLAATGGAAVGLLLSHPARRVHDGNGQG